jgi:hypothetical protein
MLLALSLTLFERVTFDRTRVTSIDWCSTQSSSAIAWFWGTTPTLRCCRNLGLLCSNFTRRLVRPAMKRPPEIRCVAKTQRKSDIFVR